MSRVLILVALAVLVGVATASFCSGTDCKDCSAFGCRSDSDCRGKCGSLYWDSTADWVCRDVSGVMTCVDGPMCQAGRYNCRNGFNDGCESTTKCCPGGSDASVCGALPNAAVVGCNVYGACGVLKCADGWADCDELESNGCETDLTSVDSCGSCMSCVEEFWMNMPVKRSSTSTLLDYGIEGFTCNAGSCEYTCINSTYDCDGRTDNGCESSIPCCTYDSATNDYNSSVCGTAPANMAWNCYAFGKKRTTNNGGWIDPNGSDHSSWYEGACNLECNAYFYDCDGEIQLNGCEAHTPCCNFNETGWWTGRVTGAGSNSDGGSCERQFYYNLGVQGLNGAQSGQVFMCASGSHGCNITYPTDWSMPILACRNSFSSTNAYDFGNIFQGFGTSTVLKTSSILDTYTGAPNYVGQYVATLYDCDGLQWNGCESDVPCCSWDTAAKKYDPSVCANLVSGYASTFANPSTATNAALFTCTAGAQGTQGAGQCRLAPAATACATGYASCDTNPAVSGSDVTNLHYIANGCESDITSQGFCGANCVDCTLYSLNGDWYDQNGVYYYYNWQYGNQDPDTPLMQCVGGSCSGTSVSAQTINCRTGTYDCDGDVLTGCESYLPCCSAGSCPSNLYAREFATATKCVANSSQLGVDWSGNKNFCVPSACGLDADGYQTYDCNGNWEWFWSAPSPFGFLDGCESILPCVAPFDPATADQVDNWLSRFTYCGSNPGDCCTGNSCGPDLNFGCNLPNVATYDIAGAYDNGDMQCYPLTCQDGWYDCDGEALNGCESNAICCTGPSDFTVSPPVLPSSATNCKLDNALTYRCDNGACNISTCLAGTASCDGNIANGCETAIAIDAKNCGSCGNACAATSNQNTVSGFKCANGKCSAVCVAGNMDCDKNFANGCERVGTTCTILPASPSGPVTVTNASTPSGQTTTITSGASTVAALSLVAYLVVLLL